MPHRHVIDVRYNELDPNNHVNHGVYVTYLEVARDAALRWCELPLDVLADRGVFLYVISISVDYVAPASNGDQLQIFTESLPRPSPLRTRWGQVIRRGETNLVTAEITSIAVGGNGRPIRPQAWVEERLARLEKESNF